MPAMIVARRRQLRTETRGVIPRGFTLIELMVTILVLGILLGVAVPSFREAALGSRLTGYANNLVASAQLARSEAIKRNAAVTLCASKNGTTCGVDAGSGWEAGWIVLAPARDIEVTTDDEDDEDGFETITLPAEVLQRQPPLSSEFRMRVAGAVTSISFPPTIVGVTPATFKVCRASPVGKQERLVAITASGSTSVRSDDKKVCP